MDAPEKTPEQMLREVKQSVKDELGPELKAEINEQVRGIVAELAKPKIEVVSTPETEIRAVWDAMREKRSVTLSGAIAYNVLKAFEKVIVDRHDILSKVRYEYGAGGQTNIPVITARPAKPTKQVEGATSIAADATAAQSVTTIIPYAYFSELFVSAENLVQGAADFAAQLPELFGESFAAAQHYGMIVGDSTMTSIFADAAITNNVVCAAVGVPTWTDFVKFAGTLKKKAFNPTIITASEFIANLILDDTSVSYEGLKMELLTKGTIRGVPVYEDPLAPTTYAVGNIVAVGMDLKNYVIAMARELVIEPIKTVGTAGTYFQATAFFNGKPILAANGYQLLGA